MYKKRLADKNHPLYPPLNYPIREKDHQTPDPLTRRSSFEVLKAGVGFIMSLIRRKIYQISFRLRSDFERLIDEHQTATTLEDKLIKVFSFLMNMWWRIFPSIFTLHEIWLAFYKIMYLIDNEQWPYWSPYLRLQHLILRSVLELKKKKSILLDEDCYIDSYLFLAINCLIKNIQI